MDEGIFRESFWWGIEERCTHDAEPHEYLVHIQMAQYSSTASGCMISREILLFDDDEILTTPLYKSVRQ
jgi:hypothetical protein